MLFSTLVAQHRRRLKLSQKGLATRLEVSPGMISKYESGDGIPRPEVVDRLAKIFEIPVEVLLESINPKTITGDSLVKIKVENSSFPEYVYFEPDDFSALKVKPKDAKCFVFHGKSMEPHINDGNLILVDTSITQLNNGGIFALEFKDGLLVRNFSIGSNSEVIMQPSNSNFPSQTFDSEFKFTIMYGKVIWRSGSIL